MDGIQLKNPETAPRSNSTKPNDFVNLTVPKNRPNANREENKRRLEESRRNNPAYRAKPPVNADEKKQQPSNIRTGNGLPKNVRPRSEQERSSDLKQQQTSGVFQRTRRIINAGRNIKQLLSDVGLWKYTEPFVDWLFGIALMVAMLKDLLDLAQIGSLPGIGTLFTFFASCIIFFSLYLAGSSSKGKAKAKGILKKYGTVAMGSLMEVIYGINFVPIETCMVILIFFFTLQERREAEIEQQLELAS